jgi:outer membrane lipoprotein carrier protein
MFHFFLIAWAWFFFNPIIAMAGNEPLPLNELLVKMQEAYEQTKDYQANFVQEVTVKALQRTEREEGIVYFKNPYLIRWDYERPKAKKLVISAKKAWLYIPEDRVVYVQNVDGFLRSKLAVRFLSGIGKLQEDFTMQYAPSEMHSLDANYLLVLIPKERHEATGKLYLSVDRATLQVVGCRFFDSYGNETKIKLVKTKVNQGLSDTLFIFRPPQGVDLVELP